MQLKGIQDIEAPIDFVFAAVTDFDGFTRQALRRGADVSRLDSLAGPVATGMAWDVAFDFRGKRRQMRIQLAECDAPNMLLAASEMPGLSSTLLLDLVSLSRNRTRLNVALELSPQTLSARLLVQSLKLARANLKKRLTKRLTTFARDTEDRFSQVS